MSEPHDRAKQQRDPSHVIQPAGEHDLADAALASVDRHVRERHAHACDAFERHPPAGHDHVIVVDPQLLRTARGTLDLRFRLDRAMAARACAPVIDRSLTTCEEALALLEMAPSELSAIYLSGGVTYMPAVRAAVERRLGVPVRTVVPPEHAVAIGAGIKAAELQLAAR